MRMYELRRVETSSQWAAFINLPWFIYRDDPHWVPPLKMGVRDLLDTKKNPFFSHAEMFPIAAFEGEKCLGRVIGVIDRNHNQFHSEKTAFFGFFEAIQDQKLVNQLLDEVAKWAKSKGMEVLRGPMNPSTNHECGLLVEGFDDSPTVMTTYNPSYYPALLEGWGMVKAKDMYAYLVDSRRKVSDRLMAHSERLKQAGQVKLRPVRAKDFDEEIGRIFDIYNDAWEKNWGFVPMEPAEFRHLAKDLKTIYDPELCLIAEVQGEVAGFALTLPDVNQAIKKVKNGKLLPTGVFNLLWNTRGPGRRKTINRCRIVTLGIKKAYREFGIGPLLYTEYFKRAPALGYPCGEASWVLEDNKPMNQALEMMCGQRTKVYRIYDSVL